MLAIVSFFLNRSKITYFLILFLLLNGIYFASKLTKEIFPPINIDTVIVSGGYSVASIASLNKIIVSELEKDILNIAGIKSVETIIQNGQFKTLAKLEQNQDSDEITSDIKDIIERQKKNYPSNMNDPTVAMLDFSFPLVQVSIASDGRDSTFLKELAKELKNDILKIKNISTVSIYDDSDYYYKFILDYQKIDSLGVNKQALMSSLSSLSHISPVGTIENINQSFFISTQNGKKDIDAILNTLIKVNNKFIYIKDIAEVKYEYKDSAILTSLNHEPSINLSLTRDKQGDSILMQTQVEELLDIWQTKYPNIDFSTYQDTTVYLINRFNVVISSLLLGMLLVGTLVWWMVNFRTAIIVSIGVPFAFLLGVMFLYFVGFSINMMTLLGALIILGVMVDDAIIVSENIQRHMNMQADKMQAIRDALSEVLMPVLVACFTTIFSFVPLLLLSGEMGEFMKLIPVAVIVLVLGSLVESFFFLPLHAKHILKVNDKELDWSKAMKVYEKVLHFIFLHKKKFLFSFYILVPFFTVLSFYTSKYNLFPQFDGNNIYIRGAFDINYTINDTLGNLGVLEEQILDHKEELFVKQFSSAAGYRLNSRGEVETRTSVFDITVELHNREEQNIIEKYITPVFSIYHDDNPKLRKISTQEALANLKEIFKDTKETLALKEFSIETDGPGIVSHPIEIKFTGDSAIIEKAIHSIGEELLATDGILNIGNNLQKGAVDLKLIINQYGETLGIDESYLARSLNSFFSYGEFSQILNDDGIISLISKDKNKDNLRTLQAFQIALPATGQFVKLEDVVQFTYTTSYKEMYKIDGKEVKHFFADIDNQKITAKEILDSLEPQLEELRAKNILVNLGGEEEQNKQLQEEMSMAFLLSMFLIFSILLLMFNSYRYAFVVLSIIPLSVLGAVLGHLIMGQDMSMPSFIGIVGLGGVVVNDGIVMLAFLRHCDNLSDLMSRAALRLRPVLITSITTFMGLSVLIFFATGQAKILQPIAISLGFGMIWGTILTLLYVPTLTAILQKIKTDNTVVPAKINEHKDETMSTLKEEQF